MVELRDHRDDAGWTRGVGHAQVHAEPLDQRCERPLGRWRAQRLGAKKGDAKEEAVRRPVPMLVGFGDVPAQIGDRGGNGRNDAGTRVANQRDDDGAFGHQHSARSTARAPVEVFL